MQLGKYKLGRHFWRLIFLRTRCQAGDLIQWRRAAFMGWSYVLCTCMFAITMKNSAKVQDDKRNVRILNGKVHIKTL